MYQLVYSSIIINKFASPGLASLLRAKAIANQDPTISGCITLYENGFLHLLEGEKSAVLRTFLKISSEGIDEHFSIIHSCESEQAMFDGSYILVGPSSVEHWSAAYVPGFINFTEFESMCHPNKGATLAERLFHALVKEKTIKENLLPASTT